MVRTVARVRVSHVFAVRAAVFIFAVGRRINPAGDDPVSGRRRDARACADVHTGTGTRTTRQAAQGRCQTERSACGDVTMHDIRSLIRRCETMVRCVRAVPDSRAFPRPPLRVPPCRSCERSRMSI